MSKRTRAVVIGGLVVAFFLAGFVSYYASNQPDGLNKVASDQGLNAKEQTHRLDGLPLAGYAAKGVRDERLSGALAGVAGVLVTFAVGGALVYVVRRSPSGDERAPMSAGHAHSHALYRPGDSVVHRLPPQCKVVAVVAFAFAVVATPAEQFWAFGGYALMLVAVAALARVPAGVVARRMLVEVPFVLFAVLLPFISHGEQVEVLGVSLSRTGLLGAWTILAKGTLGVVASILLAATTEPRQLLLGVQRLRLPALMVQIMQFMIRYADVIGAQMQRMRVARESRGFQGRDVRQLKVVAQSAGALFIRSYERGERVHLAMLSRGYTGSMPTILSVDAAPLDWARAAILPALATCVAAAAWAVPA